MLIGVNELVLVVMSCACRSRASRGCTFVKLCPYFCYLCYFVLFCYISDVFWCMFYLAFWNENFVIIH